MKIKITNAFKKSTKKLMRKQIELIEDTIDELAKNPEMGELKKGNLAGIRVYKFHIHQRLMLLAYQYSEEAVVMMSLEDYNAIEETAYLLRSPANTERLSQSIKQAKEGKMAYHDLIESAKAR